MSAPVINVASGFGDLGASPDIVNRLLKYDGDVGCLRPWIDPASGRSVITLNDGVGPDGKPKHKNVLSNAEATLSKDAYIQMDKDIVTYAKPPLRVWGDLVSEGLTHNVPDGLAVPILQYQTMQGRGNATFSMNGMRKGLRDRPLFDLNGLPLPIVHGDFSFDLRELLVSRRSGQPLDLTQAGETARACAEAVEQLTVGTYSSYSYNGYPIYGLTNFPGRITKTLTLPTAPAWTPQTTFGEMLDMIQSLSNIFYNGPYGVWFSSAWTRYLQDDYSSAYPGPSLRQKLAGIDDIKWWRKTDYLTGYQVVIVDLRPGVVRTVTGMPMQTLQWASGDGMEIFFKVMAIMVPQVRSDAIGNTGVAHGVGA